MDCKTLLSTHTDLLLLGTSHLARHNLKPLLRVIKPVISQTATSQPAEPTLRVISALTIKIPEPIMLPATIMVESSNPNDGLKSG